jgi:hypothetical protein
VLETYGVRVWPTTLVTSVDEAVAAAEALGYPVVLKATAEPLRHRPELGTVRLDIASEEELRAAYQAMSVRLDGATAGLAVQATAPPGSAGDRARRRADHPARRGPAPTRLIQAAAVTDRRTHGCGVERGAIPTTAAPSPGTRSVVRSPRMVPSTA